MQMLQQGSAKNQELLMLAIYHTLSECMKDSKGFSIHDKVNRCFKYYYFEWYKFVV